MILEYSAVAGRGDGKRDFGLQYYFNNFGGKKLLQSLLFLAGKN